MLKVQKPIWMGNSMFPITSFLMWERSIGSLDKMAIGITFTNDPLSSKAFDRVYPLQLMVMYNAFMLPRPPNGISSSEKAIIRAGQLSLLICCGWHKPHLVLSLELFDGAWNSSEGLTKKWAGSLLSCSTTLYSLCLMNLKFFKAFFLIIGSLITFG